eukprot:TRINITY_DN15553_c0_g1_i1.p1 TRINITY_DN15553_c0_g1~~TRINITY_DN15553_c0_g1_i1.p1  ORF type:complete len:304 (-),score=80.27 TRINITY_DN15553_c0_g1_i1:6-896(-)
MAQIDHTPLHRIAPAPIGSGISLRDLPYPVLSDLRKLCLHYERKAGGKYASDSRAARYLFDLSRELQGILDYIEQEDERRVKRTNHLERVVTEWDQVFGEQAGLKEGLTPKALNDELQKLRRQADELRIQLEGQRNATYDNVSALHGAVDEQHRTLRNRFEADIAALTKTHMDSTESQRREHQRLMSEQKAMYTKACHDVYQTKTQEIRDTVQKYEDKLAAAAVEQLEIIADHTAYVEKLREQTRVETQLRDMDFQRRIELLQLEHKRAMHVQKLESDKQLAHYRRQFQVQQQQTG